MKTALTAVACYSSDAVREEASKAYAGHCEEKIMQAM
jgi:hypothetical protein